MTASRFVIFSAVVVLVCAISLSEGMRIGPQRCCFSYSPRSVPIKKLVDYSMTSQQCPKAAVLFKTVKGSYVCANPADSWVQGHIKIFDSRNVGGQGSL
ncbi:monocyte chemotactic 1B-like protein [Labeo rohita]|uniref:C-C motif chemokine 18 n=2 Tax=Labeo rohita TaxID=84645 RepID=A0ABQ8LCN1_LABRO|nr:chemokine (C-C motif) ligand 35, duplicate 1 [Labeo rohita]KAI2648473.1 C-C motif chemokine 18 [Labeo rohita]RXN21908.1 monocyte chemotactic 1B-like protein [Labeo rohita]